jgi:predicted  nucleic acid-binding Zn-ribbon protein
MFGIPLEYLMFGGIGFCLAWLTALMVMPAVHNRAVRLARERYDDLPLSMQEIRAEKDTIRAGFAAATRDLEIRIEKLKERTVAHATDLAKRNQLIERLKQEIDTITAALRESETREQSARDALREARREFANKDVTLGSAEGEITVLQRDLANKDASMQGAARHISSLRDELAARDIALRTLQNDIASLRSDLSARDTAFAAAEGQIATVKAELRDSEARERQAREALDRMRRGSADKEATLGAVESEIAALKRDLAARDAALRSGERDLATLRSELAGKDTALNRAETEIAAIKAEIAALTPLLLQIEREKEVTPPRRVEVLPFVAPPRQTPQPQVVRETVQPQPVRHQAEPSVARQTELPPRTEPRPARAPIDVIPAPTRLIPPTIPQAQQQSDDSVRRAWTEIADAGRRMDERQDGPNQRLRAIYAPLVKSTP